jgi:hypothetical protein
MLTGALAAPPVTGAEKSAKKVLGEVKPDQALLYLIREGHMQAAARTMFVFADQEFLGTIDNNSYTFAYLPPGKYLLWLNWAQVNTEVELAAGKTYYFNIFGTFDVLDEVSGQAFLKGIKSYVTPEPAELEKSKEHIQERYGKATASAAKKPKDAPKATNLDRRAKHIAAWPKLDLTAYDVLCLDPIVMADPKAADRKQGYLVESAPVRMANLLAENLGSAVFREVRQGVPCEAAAGVAQLRTRITQYKPGSDAARMMLAGAGSAQLEAEVTVLDGATGKSLVAFEAKGLWAWGGALGAARGISDLEKNVAYEIASYLKNAKGVALPEEKD